MTAPRGEPRISVSEPIGGIRLIELCNPEPNYLDLPTITELGDTFEALDADPACRVIVVTGRGRHFCAGSRLDAREPPRDDAHGNPIYTQAMRLLGGRTPVVAAINGAAVGGGLGLALVADFRVGTASSRLSANFAALGLHHGFALTATLPPVVGRQRALDLLLTGRRINGAEAYQMGLLDRLVDDGNVVAGALDVAARIAVAAPLAVREIRETLQRPIRSAARIAIAREHEAQSLLRGTADYTEGIRAYATRQQPRFVGS